MCFQQSSDHSVTQNTWSKKFKYMDLQKREGLNFISRINSTLNFQKRSLRPGVNFVYSSFKIEILWIQVRSDSTKANNLPVSIFFLVLFSQMHIQSDGFLLYTMWVPVIKNTGKPGSLHPNLMPSPTLAQTSQP